MKSIYEYVTLSEYDNKTIKEVVNIISDEIMINEKFNARILSKLAKAIYDAEIHNRNKDTKSNQEYKDKLTKYKADLKAWEIEYAKWKRTQQVGQKLTFPPREPRMPTRSRANATSFASLFGPEIETSWGGNNKKVLQGIKWDAINDNDVEEYIDGADKKLLRMVRAAYAQKIQAMFILCDKKTEDVVYFVKAFGKIYNKNNKPRVYNLGHKNVQSGVHNETMPAYTYETRDLRVNELINIMKDYKVYFIQVTDNMIQTYKDEFTNRIELKKGIINFDRASLEAYRKQQQARMEVLAQELKDKRLFNQKDEMFVTIKKINEEVVSLYEAIINNPAYIDRRYDLGRLMEMVGRAYDRYYDFIKQFREIEKEKEIMRKTGESEERISKRFSGDSYTISSIKEKLRDTDEYLNEIRKEIDKIKKELL